MIDLIDKMNHAFLFQVHKEPELLNRILTHLDASNHFYAINVDGKSRVKNELDDIIKKHPNVVHVTHDPISYGGFSIVICTIKQLKCLMNSNHNICYYHTLSGQDYPCVSNYVFDSWFERNSPKSFLMIDTDEHAEEWQNSVYAPRMEQWDFSDSLQGPLSRKLHLIGLQRRLTKFIKRPCSFLPEIRGGWNWWSLNKDTAYFLIDYFDKDPKYLRRFDHTFCSDELVFTTVLHKYRDQLQLEEFNSLRYVEWNPIREYSSLPLVLRETEYDDIVHSGALFCRKVSLDESCKLLDLLDLRIKEMNPEMIPEQNPKLPYLINNYC